MSRPQVARRRPFTCDAIRFDVAGESSAVLAWVIARRGVAYGVAAYNDVVILSTSHGRRRVEIGDWVVYRGRGDFEVLPDTVFHDQFDLVGVDE